MLSRICCVSFRLFRVFALSLITVFLHSSTRDLLVLFALHSHVSHVMYSALLSHSNNTLPAVVLLLISPTV